VIRVATFNANGIRAALRRGFGERLAARDCDIVVIQELLCSLADLPELPGYHLEYDAGLLPEERERGDQCRHRSRAGLRLADVRPRPRGGGVGWFEGRLSRPSPLVTASSTGSRQGKVNSW
jgi:hypothetical protein